jgi:hypothetical protein
MPLENPMKMKFTILCITVLLGGLAVNEHRSQEARIVALRSELQGVQRQQDRWRAQGARPPLVVRAPVEVIEAPGVTVADAPLAGRRDDPSPATEAARWEEQVRANERAIEDSFTTQSMDGAWATPARQTLRDRLSTLSRSTLSSLGDVDCRSSICRVEITHRDSEAAQQFASKAFSEPTERAWNGPVLIMPSQPSADGSLASVVYLGRDGTSLWTQ